MSGQPVPVLWHPHNTEVLPGVQMGHLPQPAGGALPDAAQEDSMST